MRLILASSSPRRADLLDRLGLEYRVTPADVDEARHPDEPPAEYVERLARAKAAAVGSSGDVVIGADTIVVHEGRFLGKPSHPSEARTMLERLSGDDHEVFSGLAVIHDGDVASAVDVCHVSMLEMTDDEIADYVSSGEPMDKAGGYALQGVGGRFVKAVNGSPYTVIGMPIHLLDRLMRRVGVDMRSFRTPSI